MIPVNDNVMEEETEETQVIEIEEQPSFTYKMDLEHKIIKSTYIDEEEALRQAIDKILHTERYSCDMYDWDYGVELSDFIGQNIEEVLPDIQDSIEEALTADDRIYSLDYIEAENRKGSLYLKLQINTQFGKMEVKTNV